MVGGIANPLSGYPESLSGNGQSTVGGPKWTKMDLQAKMDQNGPFWSILVMRMLKSSLEYGHFDQTFWTILVQYTFRQYRIASPLQPPATTQPLRSQDNAPKSTIPPPPPSH